jgi:beta-galactosidase
MQRAINAGENQAGTVQFCWVDDAFLVPGKGICTWRKYQPPFHYTESVYKLPKRGLVGDCAWGTLDGWRRPRPEYWLSKKLYSPVQIENKPISLPQSGQPIVVAVENFNQFTDLSRYVCRWETRGEKGEARATAAPMSKGELRISTQSQPDADDTLVLRFLDERGKMVDVHRLAFKPHAIPVLPNSGKPARIVEQQQYLNSASDIRLLGPNVELTYDRTSGELSWGLINRELVLTQGPKLHVLKTRAPVLEYPVGSAKKIGLVYGPEDVPGDSVWQFAGADYKTEGTQAVLNWKGRYGKDFDGGFQIRMDDAGDVEFRYEFTYRGGDLWAREIGLDFELPLAFDKLNWDRKADFNYYPDDHISRPVGEAVAHPVVPQTVPARNRPYGLDDHALGCNDFRSTKRFIYTAGLTNKEGEGVRVISAGTQHIRATVGQHAIHLKVLDYYGGVAVSGDFHYGPGRLIKTGEVLKGAVKLKLLAGR